MKKLLTFVNGSIYHYVDGKRIEGPSPGMRGLVTGPSGDFTWLWGDVDLCEISDDERSAGVNVRDLAGGE